MSKSLQEFVFIIRMLLCVADLKAARYLRELEYYSFRLGLMRIRAVWAISRLFRKKDSDV